MSKVAVKFDTSALSDDEALVITVIPYDLEEPDDSSLAEIKFNRKVIDAGQDYASEVGSGIMFVRISSKQELAAAEAEETDAAENYMEGQRDTIEYKKKVEQSVLGIINSDDSPTEKVKKIIKLVDEDSWVDDEDDEDDDTVGQIA